MQSTGQSTVMAQTKMDIRPERILSSISGKLCVSMRLPRFCPIRHARVFVVRAFFFGGGGGNFRSATRRATIVMSCRD